MRTRIEPHWDESASTVYTLPRNDMASRTIVIGDIHGCHNAFVRLLDLIAPDDSDRLVLLGDLIDHGPDSRLVIDLAIQLQSKHEVVCILGNHEELLLNAIDSMDELANWLRNGGAATLRSYGWKAGGKRRTVASWIPKDHQSFLRSCLPYFETHDHIFTHAGYVANLAMIDQPPLALRWRVVDAQTAEPHVSGKTVIVGHSAQRTGKPLDVGYLKCVDTSCVRSGWLTGLDVSTGAIWQSNQQGQARRV